MPVDSRPQDLPSPALDAARYQLFGRLMDSLLHDVRNPLNALSINLEVLTERLKTAGGGQLTPPQEKHLGAIRTQVKRVDGILRAFSEFLAPAASSGLGPVNFSQGLTEAVELLGHESRRGRVQLQADLAPDLRVDFAQPQLASFLALQPLLRALARSEPGSAVQLKWFRLEPGKGVLQVLDGGAPGEPLPLALDGLRQACRVLGFEIAVRPGELQLILPLVEAAVVTPPPSQDWRKPS